MSNYLVINGMGEETQELKKTSNSQQVIPLSVISFLVGIVISSGSMFTFMEGRIEKRVREYEKVARLEERVKAMKDTNWNANNRTAEGLMSLSKRLTSIEVQINNLHKTKE